MKLKIPILVLVFMFGLVGVASAAFTLVTPADSANLGDTTILLNASADINQSSITFEAFCTGTANSTFVTICTNSTAYWDNTTTYATCNWTVADMEDGAACSFKATGNCTNETDTNTGITIDQTTPTAATSLSPADQDANKVSALTVSAAVTGSETTACTVAWEDKYPSGGSPDSMVHSGDTCTISYDNVPDGTYYYVLTVSDGTNTTDSARTSFTVDTSGSSAAVIVQALQESQAAQDKSSTTTILVVIAIIGAVMYFSRKKK